MTATFYNTETRRLELVKYTWADLTGSDTWETGVTWDDFTGGFVSSVGDTIEYMTDIIDLGRIDYVNPLCTVQTNNNFSVHVYAADQIDSSSLLPGDPVIIGGQNQTLQGVQGRYFQFKIVVENDSGDAYIAGVRTNLKSTFQQEVVNGFSGDHPGTTALRYAPIVKSYSKLLNIAGTAEPTDYNADSSTVTTIDISDRASGATITENNSVTAVNDEYKFEPGSVRFNTNTDSTVSDTNDSISFTVGGSMTGDFTIDFWYKIFSASFHTPEDDPEYQHPEYFFELSNFNGNNLKLQTQTSGGHPQLYYSWNGGAYTSVATWGTGDPYPPNYWYYARIRRSGGNISIFHHNRGSAGIASSVAGDLAGSTIALGDLGSSAGQLWIDEFRVSDTDRFGGTLVVPSAEFIIDSNTVHLISGYSQSAVVDPLVAVICKGTLDEPTQPRYSVRHQLGEALNANVSLLITGLPAIQSDSQGNIVET